MVVVLMKSNEKNALKEYLKKWASKYVISDATVSVYKNIVVFETGLSTIVGYLDKGKITGCLDIEEGFIKYMKFKNKIMKFNL